MARKRPHGEIDDKVRGEQMLDPASVPSGAVRALATAFQRVEPKDCPWQDCVRKGSTGGFYRRDEYITHINAHKAGESGGKKEDHFSFHNWTAPPMPPSLPESGPLATAPFTHASASPEAAFVPGAAPALNYERLEFLGDAYIEVFATRFVFNRYATLPVGRQSHVREQLVRNATLAKFGRLYGFDERVNYAGSGWNEEGKAKGGSSQRNSEISTKNREKIIADVFEAYVAAAILADQANSTKAVETWLYKLWLTLSDILPESIAQMPAVGVSDNFNLGDAPQSSRSVEPAKSARAVIVPASHSDNSDDNQDDKRPTGPSMLNPKDSLNQLVSTHDVRVVYKPGSPSKRQPAPPGQQSYTIEVYAVDNKSDPNAPRTQVPPVPQKLGEGTGWSKKEAGMRAAADAVHGSGKDVVYKFAQRKKAEADARREAQAQKEAAEAKEQAEFGSALEGQGDKGQQQGDELDEGPGSKKAKTA